MVREKADIPLLVMITESQSKAIKAAVKKTKMTQSDLVRVAIQTWVANQGIEFPLPELKRGIEKKGKKE